MSFSLSVSSDGDLNFAKGNDLFNSQAWLDVLSKGLGARPIYVMDSSRETGLVIIVFAKGPFRIGYAGFPIGQSAESEGLSEAAFLQMLKARFPLDIHLLRFCPSAFDRPWDFPPPVSTVTETAIVDLQGWQVERLTKRVRRDVYRALRQGFACEDVSYIEQGQQLYGLYRTTVNLRGGVARYSLKYFQALTGLAMEDRRLRIFVSMKDDKVAGFIAVALSGKTAYYLHGATDRKLAGLELGDFLVFQAIEWAKSCGADRFNMMASPAHQTGLIRYKEKWGGISRPQATYEFPIRTIPFYAFKIANWAYAYGNSVFRSFK